MTPTNDKSRTKKGKGATQVSTGFADQPKREPAPSAPPGRNEQAARSVMHPESYDPEWRYYHGAWGG